MIEHPRCFVVGLGKYSLEPNLGFFPEYLLSFHDSITIILDKYHQEHSTLIMSMLQNSLDKCRNSEGGKKQMKIRVEIMNSCFQVNDNLIE